MQQVHGLVGFGALVIGEVDIWLDHSFHCLPMGNDLFVCALFGLLAGSQKMARVGWWTT